MRYDTPANVSWLVGALCLAILPSAGAAAARHVPAQYPTIQAAIDASAAGDTVTVADGTYTGTGNVALLYKRDLVLRSESGPEGTIIDVEGAATAAFFFRNSETRNAILDGFTIRGGLGSGYAGGICCSAGSPTITNCILGGNAGAIWTIESPLIRGCLIEGNFFGIMVESDGQPEIEECTIRGGGIGVFCLDYSRPTIRNCVINGNYDRGIVLGSELVIDVIDCEIAGNSLGGINGGPGHVVGCTIANNSGSGLYAVNDVTIERSVIWGNCADQGNDIFVDGASVYLNCCAWPDSGVYLFRGGQVFSDGPRVETDPRYCGPLPCPTSGATSPGGDYSLRSDSPCLAQFSPCHEQIGYRGVGCEAPVPVGACCLTGFGCVLATAQDCDVREGVYKGDWVSCYPDPCAPSPVKEVSWGRIKAQFR